jgi:hypothetical protein
VSIAAHERIALCAIDPEIFGAREGTRAVILRPARWSV